MNGMVADIPKKKGIYWYQPPHWDEPKEVEVVEKTGVLQVQFLNGLYTTPLSAIPMGSQWKWIRESP